ncbi:MAG TPA: hypothetical protein VM870_00440, partial [Pyrinomonadaceae bacterium]|nr:hypothetical protein [Pyrinomonadaceae bacterium]
MPHKRNILFITLVIAFLGAAVVGVEYARRTSPRPSPPVTSGATPFPREVRDGGGEVLRLARPPQKIVSQTLATDEILLAITAPERIAALSSVALEPQYSNIVEQAQALGLPTIKDAEGIIALKPDLIFISSYS